MRINNKPGSCYILHKVIKLRNTLILQLVLLIFKDFCNISVILLFNYFQIKQTLNIYMITSVNDCKILRSCG